MLSIGQGLCSAVKLVALFRSAFGAFAVCLCLFEIEMVVHNTKLKKSINFAFAPLQSQTKFICTA